MNGRASGSVVLSGFLVDLAHSAPSFPVWLARPMRMWVRGGMKEDGGGWIRKSVVVCDG